MRMSRIIFVVLCGALIATAAWGQVEPAPAPEDTQHTAPPPAFGPDASPVVVNDNPPISGLDRPALEPGIQPRSMLLGGVEASESLDSNIGSDARPALHSVTRGLGGLTAQRLWNRYQLSAAYVGGVGYYNQAGIRLQQIHELQAQQSILWRRGQLTMRDSFSYLPEGSFGFGSYGGAGGFQLGLGGLGQGMGALGSGFGGQSGIMGAGQFGSLGQAPRITNVALVDVVESLSRRSSVTAAGSFGIVHFTDNSQGFINSHQASGQAGYNYAINPQDQVAVNYGYQAFTFPQIGGSEDVHTHTVQGMYGHRISGRMDLVIGAGPQWTQVHDPLFGDTSRLSVAGHFTLHYRFRQTSATASFERYDTNGSGFFAGAQSNIARLALSRHLGRRFNAQADFGYAHNSRLQGTSSVGVNSSSYQYGFAGFAVRREFGYNWGAFLSYQWNDQIFDTCPVAGTFCNRISVRHVLTVGVDWHFRPIRID